MKKLFVSFAVVVFLSGCIDGKFDYVRPISHVSNSNLKIIERSRDSVWDASVPELGKRFFVINNLDKSSGFINLSYTGDPEQYVDCGQLTSYVKNARGERTYQFPGSRAQQTYEGIEGINLFSVERKMNLEGRVNVIFEENGSHQTRVTVNTKYVLTKQVTTTHAGDGVRDNSTDTISFGTDSGASYSMTGQGKTTECVPTGKLEQDILSAIK